MWRLTITQTEQRAYSSIEGTYESKNEVRVESNTFSDLARLVANFADFEINNTTFTIEKVVEEERGDL